MQDSDKFDCIIVGGGVAGLAAAYTLAKANLKILLVERGDWTGAKNVSGGVLWGPTAFDIFPALLNDFSSDCPYERVITHRRLSFMSETSATTFDFKTDNFYKKPYNGIAVLRSRFDKWLGQQVEEAIAESDFAEDSLVATGILVDRLLLEDNKVVGIGAGEDTFSSDCVIIAEGVNSLLTRAVGLQTGYVEAELVGTGIKEVWQFDQEMLEAKFQLEGDKGMSNEFVGCTQGVEGGAFLYTNKDTISLGMVLGLAALREHKKAPHDLLDAFKQHPAIRPILKHGKMVEYSAHVVPVGDIRLVPKKLYMSGAMVVGDAAGLLLNTGKAIEGMNMAMESGRQAAYTVIDAKKRQDYSESFLKSYQERLAETFVLKDMVRFQGAVKFIHNPAMFERYPLFVNTILERAFTVDGKPKKKMTEILPEIIREQNLSYWELLSTAVKGGLNL